MVTMWFIIIGQALLKVPKALTAWWPCALVILWKTGKIITCKSQNEVFHSSISRSGTMSNSLVLLEGQSILDSYTPIRRGISQHVLADVALSLCSRQNRNCVGRRGLLAHFVVSDEELLRKCQGRMFSRYLERVSRSKTESVSKESRNSEVLWVTKLSVSYFSRRKDLAITWRCCHRRVTSSL